MGRKPRSETCINCKKVPDGEFCTDRCLPKQKRKDSIADQIEVRNPDYIFMKAAKDVDSN
jgi:hypothetical protein